MMFSRHSSHVSKASEEEARSRRVMRRSMLRQVLIMQWSQLLEPCLLYILYRQPYLYYGFAKYLIANSQ
jgi:hypothetical protein